LAGPAADITLVTAYSGIAEIRCILARHSHRLLGVLTGHRLERAGSNDPTSFASLRTFAWPGRAATARERPRPSRSNHAGGIFGGIFKKSDWSVCILCPALTRRYGSRVQFPPPHHLTERRPGKAAFLFSVVPDQAVAACPAVTTISILHSGSDSAACTVARGGAVPGVTQASQTSFIAPISLMSAR
jgi:hypothetical protein